MATKYQAQVSVDGSPWKPVGHAMPNRLLVEASIDDYKDQVAKGQVAEGEPRLVVHYFFRVVFWDEDTAGAETPTGTSAGEGSVPVGRREKS